jgi:hypothetical protein
MSSSKAGGLRAAFGCTPEGLALFRITVGVLLVSELVLRFRFLHPFFTDEGYGRLSCQCVQYRPISHPARLTFYLVIPFQNHASALVATQN